LVDLFAGRRVFVSSKLDISIKQEIENNNKWMPNKQFQRKD